MPLYQNRRLRAEDFETDERTFTGIQTLADYAPRDQSCSNRELQILNQRVHATRQAEMRAEQALAVARSAAIAAEWDQHNALVKARNEVRVQYGDESDLLHAVGLKKRSERRRPVRYTTTRDKKAG